MHTRTNSQVKNKQAAKMQITAEQIMREAVERQESEYIPPKQKIQDLEELEHYQVTKRKSYEDSIRKNQQHVGNWIKYAKFEEEQQQFKHARSVYERALKVDHKNPLLWLKYADMEMRNKNINRARNVWERATQLLPRVDQFWLKYVLMEDMLGNFAGARQICERWMAWEPSKRAWGTYINMELRHHEVEQVRSIYERFVIVHPETTTWIKFAKFEHKHGDNERARTVYQRAIDFLGEDNFDKCEELFIKFAEFEVIVREFERARAIFKYALDHIPKGKANELYKKFIAFEKQYGNKAGIEEAIVNKRRFYYNEELKQNPMNYDAWFDYIRLEEENGDSSRIQEIFERAIANIPPANEKRFWRRYIYLWINYAIFEELENDVKKAREVYNEAIKLIPHNKFSFSKIWILFANFELRQGNLTGARKIFGMAIGKAPKSKIFQEYIDLESKLGNIDRVRTLYEKWLKTFPFDCNAWCKYAEAEDILEESERARAIYQTAIQQPLLDMPELVWKSFIDFEITEEEYDNVRSLYEQLLERSQHVKVWISFAQFEHSIEEIENARSVFEKAYKSLRNCELKEDRVLLVETWREFEEQLEDAEGIAEVKKLLPKRVVKVRDIKNDDGTDAGKEEYYDYIFPDELENQPPRLLELAQQWKKQKIQNSDD